MKPSLAIRIASVVTLVFAVLHTAGRPWTPTRGAAESAVVAAMQKVHFLAFGSDRTYWDFYQGFGYAIGGLLAAQALLLWLLSTETRRGTRHRAAAVTHAAGLLWVGLIAALFILWPPVLLSIGAAALLLIAAALPPEASASS
jgi:hypothetical protein